MGLAHSPRVVTDGLVLCLDAANQKSYPGTGTVWTDLSGNDNTTTFATTPIFNNNSMGGIEFSTDPTWVSGSYTDVPNSTTLSNITTFTLSFCIYSAGSQSANGGSVFHKALEGVSGFVCEPLNNAIRFNYGDGTSWFWSAFSTQLIHNIYSIYDIVYNGSQVKIYKNAIELSTHNANIAWDNTNVIRIGRRRGHLQHYLYGSIFYEKFYNRVLSPQEIQQNFNALRGRYGL